MRKNKELEIENKSMEPAKQLLSSVQIYQSTKSQDERIINDVVWKEISLLDNHVDTGTHLIYQDEDPDHRTIIPIEQIARLNAKISGFHVKTRTSDDSRIQVHIARFPPRIALNHELGSVQMEFYCSQLISITGEVINLSGSLSEVEEMIASSSVDEYFHVNTGLPIFPPSNENNTCLDGAKFVLHSINISKDNLSVQDLIAELKFFDKTNDDYKEDTLFQELDLLSKVEDGQCQELNAVASERKGLLVSNASLQLAWDWLKYFIVNIPYGNGESYRLFSVDCVTEGCLSNCIFDNVPVIKFEVSEENGSDMQIDSIMGLKVELGHDSSKSLATYFRMGQFVETEGGIWLRCGANIGVYFTLDESFNEIDLDYRQMPLSHYLLIQYLQAINDPFGHLDLSEEPDFTMRLKYITIRLDVIQQQLDVLGVEPTVSPGAD